LPKSRVSFSPELLYGSPRVAGGNEPPSVLSDNLPVVFPQPRSVGRGCSRSSALTLLPCQRALRGSALYCRALQFADEGRLERAHSPVVGIETGGCAPTGLRLRWWPARSQFVINVLVRGHNLGRSHRYRTYRWVRVSVMPSFAGRSPCRESPERQRRRRNQRSPGVGSADSRGEVVRARRGCACWTPGT
jgi:hypothetical protein